MSYLTRCNEGYERAANLARDIESTGDSLRQAEITKGIFRLFSEIKETERCALERARPKLKRAAQWYPKSLLERKIRDIIYQSLAESLLALHKRCINEWTAGRKRS